MNIYSRYIYQPDLQCPICVYNIHEAELGHLVGPWILRSSSKI